MHNSYHKQSQVSCAPNLSVAQATEG
jgi:hypothetical protein